MSTPAEKRRAGLRTEASPAHDLNHTRHHADDASEVKPLPVTFRAGLSRFELVEERHGRGLYCVTLPWARRGYQLLRRDGNGMAGLRFATLTDAWAAMVGKEGLQ